MKLYEYEAKNVLAKYGVGTPHGGLATNPGQAREVAQKLTMPVVVKAQVLVAGRGKAGGFFRPICGRRTKGHRETAQYAN